MRLSFKNKATPENIRVKIVAKNTSSIKLIGDVTAPGNNPTMVLNGGELVFCLAPVLTQGVWDLTPEFNITKGIATYTAYKNIRTTRYFSHANVELTQAIVNSLHNNDMQQWQAVKDAVVASVNINVNNIIFDETTGNYYTIAKSEYSQYAYYWSVANAPLDNEWTSFLGHEQACRAYANTFAGFIYRTSTDNTCYGNFDPPPMSKNSNPYYREDWQTTAPKVLIPRLSIAQKIISNTSSSNQGISLLAEAYLEEVAKSIFEVIQFVTKEELLSQFEENIIRVSYKGVDQEHVKINKYTTSALDFEKGLIDKIPGVTWNLSGNNTIQSNNTLFSNYSIETKALGDSLYTNSNVITGGSTPFTIEAYYLFNQDFSTTASGTDLSLFSLPNNSGYYQGYFLSKSLMNIGVYRAPQFSKPITDDSFLNKRKLRVNEINKITITYDGASLRSFINDELDGTYGTSIGLEKSAQAFQFMSYNFGTNNTTRGIIDNINIFDGIATKVRDPDPHEEFLIVDLAFDGENNSTKIVDNGTLKSNWTVNGNAKISTDQKFDGFSSLDCTVNGSFIESTNDNIILGLEDFTLSVDIISTASTQTWKSICGNFDNTTNGTWSLWLLPDNKMIFSTHPNQAIVGNMILQLNTRYNLRIIRTGGVLYLYINGELDLSASYIDVNINSTKQIRVGYNYITDDKFNGYIKNFKIYKGVAIIPESPVGKIQLDFDNNVIDKYNNSTWTNNGVTFDQVNSVKGHAVKFIGNSNITTTSTDLNFENNGFDLSYDIKLTDVSVGTRYAITNNKNYTTAGSIWLAGSSHLGFDYVGRPANSGSLGVTNIAANNYYNQTVNRRNNTLVVRYNDVILGAHNLTNQRFNFVNGGNMAIGRSSNFGVGESINGYIDNFKSRKESFDVVKDGTEGVWIQTVADCNSKDMQKYDFNNITSATYDEYYSNTRSFAALNYKRGSGSVTITSPVIINKSILNKSFNVFAQNGCWYYSQINVTMEILDSANNVIAALKWNRVNTYSHFMYYGTNLNNLTQSAYKGSYPGTFGTLYFKEDQIEFVHNDAYSDTNTSFVYNVNLTNAKSIRVANLYAEEDYDSCRSFFVLTKLPDIASNVGNLPKLVIDRPAVHLPLETNSTNIGFSALTINSVGSPTYTTIDGKKCIKFESGKYLTINSNNIFNLGTSSDFYIEFDFYPIKSTNGLISNSSAWVSGTIYLIHYIDQIMLQSWKNNVVTNITTINKVILNSWNNVKLYRKGSIVYISLNDIVIQSTFNVDVDFCFSGSNLSIGTYGTDSNLSENASNAYMSNFKMFVGTSEIPETYNDKKVLDLDFNPTRTSYLFKDNNNKCVIHPANIAQRDYQNSQYCCTFNGANQYLQLGKNELFNFGNDDFVINIKFKLTSLNNPWQTILSCGKTDTSNSNKTAISINSQYIFIVSNNAFWRSTTQIKINIEYDIKIVKVNSVYKLFINDVESQVIPNNSIDNRIEPTNFNFNSNTVIGANLWDGAAGYFQGTIYSIKVLRNTSDITLLEDVWVDPFPPEPEAPPFEEGVLNFTELLKDIDPHNVVLDFKQLRYT